MKRGLSRRSALVLAPLLLGALAVPAQACRYNDGIDPQEPFSDHYLEHFKIIFRGCPVDFRLLDDDPDRWLRAAEISFDVIESYRGQKNETVTALWFVDLVLKTEDLDALKRQIGEDLVVVLGEPNRYSLEFSPLPPIVYDSCYESAMRSYTAMEPALRKMNLIE